MYALIGLVYAFIALVYAFIALVYAFIASIVYVLTYGTRITSDDFDMTYSDVVAEQHEHAISFDYLLPARFNEHNKWI